MEVALLIVKNLESDKNVQLVTGDADVARQPAEVNVEA